MRAAAARLAVLGLAVAACAERGSQPLPPWQPPALLGTKPPPQPPLRGARPSTVDASVVIQCRKETHPISPLVYGIGVQPMRDKPEQFTLGATARRWGGNHTTRYNWELGNAWNTGKDWFFKNVDYDHASRPAYERFLEDDVAHGMSTALTVPTIGWVAKDTTSSGFPAALFGRQQAEEPGHPEIGNGVSPSGALLPPKSPEQTSVAMSPPAIGRWVRTIRERDRVRGKRSVQMYILDNEPTLWSETHRDIHPEPVSYDELLDRTTAYAAEIRRADPEAQIAGPALWGWTAYFGSGVDRAAYPKHPDRDRHGGVALLPWWLREIAAHESRTGLRLLDVVDVHFYPQGRNLGIGAAGNTDEETSARRIRATRALWDPSYKDESWIGEPVKLIPRLKSWIGEAHPGLGISLGEYNFGAETHMSGGLAVAEALGRFGTEGITSAFYWDYPPVGSPAHAAFLAYRNFDGKGGHFLDVSVPATSSSPATSVFASRDAGGEHLVLVVLDLDPKSGASAAIDLGTCGAIESQRAYTYVAGTSGFAARNIEHAAGTGAFSLALPPYSITVVDVHLTATP